MASLCCWSFRKWRMLVRALEVMTKFSQADLQSGIVQFRHDGTNSEKASFDVVVADHAGATSGSARTVQVAVAR